MLTKHSTFEALKLHLAEIQRMAKIGSWELDLVTNELSWSEEIFRIFELNHNEFGASYEAFLGAIHPDDRQRVNETYISSIKQKTPYEVQHRLLMKDGRIKFVREKCETFYDNEKPIRSIGTIQDISTERHILDALRINQDRLMSAEGLARLGHYSSIIGEDAVTWSESVFRIFGKTPDTFMPTLSNILRLIHPEDRDALIDQRTNAFEGRDCSPLMLRMVKDDGQLAYLECWSRPQFETDGSVRGLFGTVQDVTRRVSAELNLSDAKQRYELVEAAVNDGIWDWNILTGSLYVSPRWKNIMGYGPNETINDANQFFSSLHPDDVAGVEEAVRLSIEEYLPYDIEFRLRHSEGDYRWIRSRASVIRDDDGHSVRMLGSITDVGAEREVKAIRRSQELSRQLKSSIAEAPVAIAMFDLEMCYLSASNRWRNIFNDTVDDLKRFPMGGLSTDFSARWRDEFQRALNGGTGHIEEACWTRENGIDVWVRFALSSWRDAQDRVCGVVTYAEDITAKKEADSERSRRRALSEWMGKITNSIPGMIGTLKMDSEGHISLPQCSGQIFDVFGLTPETVLTDASAIFERITADSAGLIVASIRKSALELSSWHEEFRYNHPSKGEIWIEVHSNPEKQDDGAVVWNGFAQDITVRKHLEFDAHQKAEALHHAQKMELVGQLSAGIAHDFNNLLAVIAGSMEFFGDWVKTGTLPDQKLIAASLNACQRGKDLVQRLLNFSRQSPVRPEPTAIDPLILDVFTILQRTLGESIEVKMKLVAGGAIALVDRSQFSSALLNLALNSRDAMPSGGCLTIETWVRPAMQGTSTVSLDIDQRDEICVKVSDTGCGMSEDVRLLALNAGYTTKLEGLGAGLGLSMVSSFVEISGGHINVESDLDQGTSITFCLPRLQCAPEEERQTSGESSASFRKKGMVLLLEDDPDVRAIVGAQLQKLNYEVRSAATGTEALDIINSPAEIAILLTDVILRGNIDGIEVVKEALRLRPRLGVLCMSGYATPDAQKKSLRLQNIRLLAKPFRISELAEALDELELDNLSGQRESI